MFSVNNLSDFIPWKSNIKSITVLVGLLVADVSMDTFIVVAFLAIIKFLSSLSKLVSPLSLGHEFLFP